MPRLADGTFISSRVKSLQRIREYLVLFANHNSGAKLRDLIELRTADDDVHPNAVIYELLIILISIYRGMGRSAVPSLDEAIKRAKKDELGLGLHDSGIILPN